MFDVNGYTLGFLAFSLALAFIPFGASIVLRKKDLSKVFFWPLLVIWFLFFPNIPYLFTKGRYLMGYCGDTAWDLCGNSWMIGFFFIHALIGAPLMYLSIRYVSTALKRGPIAINHFVLAVVMSAFSALALPIGLYGRFNSWHLIIQLPEVMSFTLQFVASNSMEIVTWFVIFVLTYLLIHAFVHSIQKKGSLEP